LHRSPVACCSYAVSVTNIEELLPTMLISVDESRERQMNKHTFPTRFQNNEFTFCYTQSKPPTVLFISLFISFFNMGVRKITSFVRSFVTITGPYLESLEAVQNLVSSSSKISLHIVFLILGLGYLHYLFLPPFRKRVLIYFSFDHANYVSCPSQPPFFIIPVVCNEKYNCKVAYLILYFAVIALLLGAKFS
jgi:hypothetical protein